MDRGLIYAGAKNGGVYGRQAAVCVKGSGLCHVSAPKLSGDSIRADSGRSRGPVIISRRDDRILTATVV